MRRLTILITVVACLQGCTPREEVTLKRATADRLGASYQQYLADYEYRRGYIQAMRDSVTWPSEAAR